MAGIVSVDTDEEMDRYNEAELIAANPPPLELTQNKMSVFNTSTGRNDIVVPMDAGGFVKLADEPRDRSAEIQQYATELQNIGMPFDLADLEAAGYSAEEINAAGVMPIAAEPSGRTEPMSEGERLIELRSGGAVIEERPESRYYTGGDTMREAARYGTYLNSEGELRQIFQALGVDEFTARHIAEGIWGNPNSTRDLGIGVADFTGFGLFFGAQEGMETFTRGRNTGDPITMGMGALEAGLSVLEAVPLTVAGAKTFKAAIPKLRNAFVDLGKNAETRIAEEGDTLFSNPITPVTDRMLKLIGRLVAPKEKTIILDAMPDEEIATAAQAQIAAQKDNYKPGDGWLQDGMEVTSVKRKKNGSIEVKYKEVPYNFHIAPEGVDPQKWEQTITSKTVKEVNELAKRAAAGDQAALDIIAQANWYRSMRARMRQEFGGLGDVYADLLGTTSAQTGVTQNWDNAVEIMRRFSRGEYDQEIAMYEEMLARGEANPIDLGKLHNDPNSPFKLITKASGALFNANSPASTKALLDMFRVAKGAPKTPNFTGNLIGYTNAATVDVWAARFLRRMSGQKRLPPPVEKGVAGDHMKDSTLENPLVGSEFGFGQRVIQAAVDKLNKSGVIKNIDPGIGDMGADDLQAVMWFMEKEKWTAQGWTSKAGEGGSLDFEASLAGSPDQSRIKELRTIINKKYTAPKPLKQKADETDEAYQARMAERETTARKKYDEGVAAAEAELQTKFTPLVRYVLGISTERPGARPTNVQQADTAAQLAEPVNPDDSVVMFQINNSYGRFMSKDERSFNAEFVVRENFNPTELRNRMVEIGRDADQDSVFISKIVPDRTPDSRPGVEIYFKQRKDKDFAVTLSDKLTEYGVDGFTFITDARAFDTPARQANLNEEAVAGITGLRFQYIPEFDMGADAWKAMTPEQKAAKIDEMEDKFNDIIIDIKRQGDDISTAIVTHNETEVIERGGYDAILGAPAQ
jgi:hypothetical protein